MSGSESVFSRNNSDTSQSSTHNATFIRLLSFVAISQTEKADETLEQLLLQCVLLFPADAYADPADFCTNLKGLFGLEIPLERIQTTIDELVNEGSLVRTEAYTLQIRTDVREQIESRVEAAKKLQERVRLQWLEICKGKCPGANVNNAWLCLEEYLFRLFRRHGMQTVALLNSKVAETSEHAIILKASLSEVLTQKCPAADRVKVELAINQFLGTVGSDPDRTAYIVQLADGAFNYYALSAPPEVAIHLKSKLNPLTLFLDTNFLFGAFGLDNTPFGAVSAELLNAVSKNNLPFKLRYHEATDVELRRTINAILTDVRSRNWSPALSRAAITSPFVSGVERHFHEQNAKHPIDPDVFFKPYQHFDVLLKDKGITVYREQPSLDQRERRTKLAQNYNAFLTARSRAKPIEAINHDAALLETVRQLRSTSASSLDAKALVITCDTNLNRFDWEAFEKNKGLASTVLPSHFLQLLRPYLPASDDFDRSFAETFAVPEFRAISGGYHAAAGKLLSLLATYKDIREETASALLANTLLLENLQKTNNPKKMMEIVDAAIVMEYNSLLEEQVLLRTALQQEQAEVKATKAATHAELASIQHEKERLALEKRGLASDLQQARTDLSDLKDKFANSSLETTKVIDQIQRDLASVRQAQIAAHKKLTWTQIGLVAALSAAGCAILELMARHYSWGWLLNHPNSYGIRALTYLGVLSFGIGLVRREWRNVLWVAVCLAALIALLSILGGPPVK